MFIENFNLNKNVFIIAEIGNNHEGNFKLAKELIGLAAKCGVNAVKFQSIDPEKLVRPNEYVRIKQLKKFQLSFKEYRQLAKYAAKKNLLFMITPFDIDSVKFINSIAPVIKISSGDNNFYQMLNAIAETGKPLIMSTGLSDINQIKKSVKFIEAKWKKMKIKQEVWLLHCVSLYPTPYEKSNLKNILNLKKISNNIGYSDHTVGMEACLVAVTLGARIIEKHFTIDNNYSNFHDHKISLNPKDMQQLVKSIRIIEKTIIKNNKTKIVDRLEKVAAKKIRRSIVANKNLYKDQVIKYDDLTWLRPGEGLSPGNEKKIVNKKLKKNILVGDIILPKHIK